MDERESEIGLRLAETFPRQLVHMYFMAEACIREERFKSLPLRMHRHALYQAETSRLYALCCRYSRMRLATSMSKPATLTVNAVALSVTMTTASTCGSAFQAQRVSGRGVGLWGVREAPQPRWRLLRRKRRTDPRGRCIFEPFDTSFGRRPCMNTHLAVRVRVRVQPRDSV